MLTQSDAKHIFNQLRTGLVPERGLDAFAVGVDFERVCGRRVLMAA